MNEGTIEATGAMMETFDTAIAGEPSLCRYVRMYVYLYLCMHVCMMYVCMYV